MILVYSIHVLAAGAWVGGLPPLLFALVEQRRFNAPEARDATLEILSRFSIMAMIAVSLMVVTARPMLGFASAAPSPKYLTPIMAMFWPPRLASLA